MKSTLRSPSGSLLLLWCSGFSYQRPVTHDDVIKWKLFRVTGLLCGEFTSPGEFPTQRPVTRSFDVFFDLGLNKQLSKQWRRRWFKTPWHSLRRHRNDRKRFDLVMLSCFPTTVPAPNSARPSAGPVLTIKLVMFLSGISSYQRFYINGLVQGRRNSIANALELHLSCTNPSK